MTDGRLKYLRPPGLRGKRLREALADVGKVRGSPAVRVRRVFLDTFDWRLFRKGFVLEAATSDGEAQLLWRELQGPPLHRIQAPAPRFARDLAEGAFRRKLEDLVEMRALLPVAEIVTRSETLELLDAAEKVVCRVRLETHAAELGGAPRALPPTLRVEPVRGYEAALAAVQAVVAEGLGLSPLETDVLSLALAEGGVAPSGHSTKVRVDLEPEMPALQAARLVFRSLFETMEDNEAGVRADVDSEFLHDFRVAVRRTRAALGQFKKALPPKVFDRFRAEFAWLGAVTTPVRDLDVHLLDYPRYRDALPLDLRPDLAPLFDFLCARQKREHEALVQVLSSRRYRRLLVAWHRFVDAEGTPARKSPGAGPVRKLACGRVRKVFRRALKEGRSLGEHSPPADFHELRKTCKKLRYLMEFFQSLFPADELRPFIDDLKGLQDNLGEFQDLTVQTEALRRWAGEMEAGGVAGARTHLAMGMLVEKLLTRQNLVRGEFAEAFRAFSDAAKVERFDGLLRGLRDEEAIPP